VTKPPKLVDLYLRLSVDREGKDSLDRQEADLRKWAKDNGLIVRTVWRDSGKSGYQKGVLREDFNSAIDALTAGEVGTLAVWKLDRLSRRGAGHVGKIMDDIEDVGGRIVFLRDGFDTSDDAHRTLILLVSEQARTESKNTSLRVRAKIGADAAKGIPKIGTRPFGYENDGIALRESEASLIRVAVDDYLHGRRSLVRIAHDWNEAGVRTDGMNRERRGRDGVKRPARTYWTATTVRQVLRRPRNAGLLVHDGGVLPQSRIQPIITLEEHADLNARAKAGTPLGARATTLLGGILRCECGAPMHGTVSYSQRKGGPRNVYPVYKCSQTLYDKTARHATINAGIADEAVIARTLLRIAEGDMPDADDGGVAERLGDIAARQVKLSARRARAVEILQDPDLKSMYASTKGQLKAVEAAENSLRIEADALAAQRADGGALSEFVDLWHELPEEVRASHGENGWDTLLLVAGRMLWDDFALDRQQDVVRGLWRRLSVAVGGRGVSRIDFTH
jgi:DNA invertase Pin-like site-specific DNA recombinase